MSYEEYFSQERELIASPFATSDSNWESEPFYVTESTVNWLKNAHPEEKKLHKSWKYLSTEKGWRGSAFNSFGKGAIYQL